jgi:hypothetical protein
MIRAFGLPHFGQTSRCGLGVLETALRALGRRSGCDSLMVVSHHSGLARASAHFCAESRPPVRERGFGFSRLDAIPAPSGASIAERTGGGPEWPRTLAE